MKRYTVMVICALLVLSCGDATGPEEGPGGETTYTIDGFTITWQMSATSSDSLVVTVTAPTTGWVAVGFQPSQFMEDADLKIGYVDSGVLNIRDDFGTGAVTHDADTNLGGSSNITGLSGSETVTATTVSFRMPYDSGDSYDKVLTEGNTYTFIFAYGAYGADDFTSSHIWAESVSLEL